jgi:hypothetical protein
VTETEKALIVVDLVVKWLLNPSRDGLYSPFTLHRAEGMLKELILDVEAKCKS